MSGEDMGATSLRGQQNQRGTSSVALHAGNSPDAAMSPVRAHDVDGDTPFKPSQLSRIDEALTLASRETGLLFSVYVGGFTGVSREFAEHLYAKLATRYPDPVLLAISPGQRRLEILTGGTAAGRIPNRVCDLAALAMRASFAGGDLTGGIVNGLRQLADAAGSA